MQQLPAEGGVHTNRVTVPSDLSVTAEDGEDAAAADGTGNSNEYAAPPLWEWSWVHIHYCNEQYHVTAHYRKKLSAPENQGPRQEQVMAVFRVNSSEGTEEKSSPSILTLTAVRHHVLGAITADKLMDVTVTIKSSIDTEPALVLGPLKSVEETRREQQLAEIEARRLQRQKSDAEETDIQPPVQEVVEELQGPFTYEFSYWARHVTLH
ncbi:unnamed protein product [Ranitomeya imitator]|uniref:Uncharacterized protein n=1 Tax=Ranitomeya imitator TaxID=111125 RepID=A0ABN9MKB2_9NEOB|nr:unnamed protein product [Ranitomeya imitator]